MRIAHLADVHLGYRQFQRLEASGLNQREADVAAAFRGAIDAVVAGRPDAVLIAGDLFHSVRPTNRAIVEAFTQLKRLREALPAAPVVLIAGNHDTPRSVEAGSILKLMTALDVDVVDDAARRLDYPALGLSVLAVPHAALAGDRPGGGWRPNAEARHNVLVLHPEVAGLFPDGVTDYGGARVEVAELGDGAFDYVALGHYHIVHEVAPMIWYSGSLEYTSHDIWRECREERRRGLAKGLLLADLEARSVARIDLPLARPVLDLEWLDAEGMTAAELDAAIRRRLEGVGDGFAGAVVRLVVRNVPRALAHALDHDALRPWRASALHLHLDLRRPEPATRLTGAGAPGRRRPLPEIAAEYLARRPLDADLDREQLVALARGYLDQVERTLVEGEA
jgi:exonuclease SbcD